MAQFIRPLAILGRIVGQKQVDRLGRRVGLGRRLSVVQTFLLGRDPGRPGVQRKRLRVSRRSFCKPPRISQAIAFPFMREIKIRVHFSSAVLQCL